MPQSDKQYFAHEPKLSIVDTEKIQNLKINLKHLAEKYRLSSELTQVLISGFYDLLYSGETSEAYTLLLMHAKSETSDTFIDELSKIAKKAFNLINEKGFIVSTKIHGGKNQICFKPRQAEFIDHQTHISSLSSTITNLVRDGYSVAPFLIPQDKINKIRNKLYAIEDFKLRGNFETYNSNIWREINGFNFNTATAPAVELFNIPQIQQIIFSDFVYKIACRYLDTDTIYVTNLQAWFSLRTSELCTESGNKFHFDMTSLKWLKMFIYLNDVTELNGPHTAIHGTHKPNTKPPSILNSGYLYTHWDDNDLLPAIQQESMLLSSHIKVHEYLGKRGTVIFGDTNAFHKGKPVLKGYRLIMSVDYCIDATNDIVIERFTG